MAKQHVPKFGNWDSDDVPYTICFENARELRANGKTFNPNDPDDYPPEVFLSVNKPVSPDRHRHQLNDVDRGNQKPKQAPNNEHPRRNKRIDSSSGSEHNVSNERSSSDRGLLKKVNQPKRSQGRGISRFPPMAHRGNGNPRKSSFHQQQKRDEGEMVSVPKFGSWDEKDPRSGEKFTAIFSKVKMEKKKIGDSNVHVQTVPPLMPTQANSNASKINQTSTSFVSKICCCMYRKEST